LISILFFQAIIAFSQTFYETKFKDVRGNIYLGFMVYYGGNDCYMRVAFTQADIYNVVNVDYESITGTTAIDSGGTDSLEYLLLEGKNPTYITSNPTGMGYNPEHFLWYWSGKASTDNEKPYYTVDPDLKPENLTQVDYFRELKLSQLSKEYLRQFYVSNEADYLSFLNAIENQNTDTAAYVANTSGPTLHLFIMANTLVSNVGLCCTIDMNNFKAEFEGIAQALNINIKEYFLSDNSFSKQNLLTEMDAIKPDTNDILVFLYSGHGFRWNDQTDYYPQFDLRTSEYQDLNTASSISLSTVYNTLIGKGARLTLVLSNCCNSTVGINQVTTSSYLSSMSIQNYNKSNLSKLILSSSGNIIATAASPGESAWGNNSNGSFFVNGFLQSFRQEISFLNSKDPDWDGIIKNTISNAKQITSPPSCPNCNVQNGMMYTKLSK
jgi:hypothetical protein